MNTHTPANGHGQGPNTPATIEPTDRPQRRRDRHDGAHVQGISHEPPAHTTKATHLPPHGFANGTAHAFAIKCRAFATFAAFDNHERARNFFATIEHDPTAPAGLARHFHELTRGAYYYSAADLRTGQAVEIGADRRTARNHTTRRRYYASVEALQIDDSGNGFALLRFFDTPADAITHAEQIAEKIKTGTGTTAEQGANRARQFARQFAEAVETFAAEYENKPNAAAPAESADDFARRLLVSAAAQLDSEPASARALPSLNFTLEFSRVP